jgi:glucose/arabinose dehydrogenase
VRTTQRATILVAGLAVLALTAGPSLANQAPQQPPPQQQEPQQQPPPPQEQQPKQAQPIEGELVSVDADAKALTVKVADGTEVKFHYDDRTEISGAKGAAGLATMKEGRVTVHFKDDAQAKTKLATKIIVQPRQ